MSSITKFITALFSAVLIGSVLLSANLYADNQNITKYIRLDVDSQNAEPLALESSIQYLKSSDSAGDFEVDLVSAIHIADAGYYKLLDQKFKSYDAVLFELVAEQGDLKKLDQLSADNKNSATDQKSDVSALQSALGNFLNLSFQLEQINYSAENFVHADMSPSELKQGMKDRGESFQSIFLRAMAKNAEAGGQTAPVNLSDLMLLLTGKYSATGLKRLVARQFGDMQELTEALNGKNGITLINGRNAVVIESLKKELKAGKRKIAIFYGAAHMPDMFKQFSSVWPVKSERTEWLKAWDLKLETAS